jgi:hypothetical protein
MKGGWQAVYDHMETQRRLDQNLPVLGGRLTPVASAFSSVTISTREGAARFAFFFSAKSVGLDPALSLTRLPRKISRARPVAR